MVFCLKSMMGRMQSLHSHCCCCACSVFSALFGMLMLSTGVCLVLNYGILDVDTGGLPPELHNEEGKKVVGIILISVGLIAITISAIVSILYFTVCSRPKPQVGALESQTDNQKGSSSSTSHSTKPKHRPKHKSIHELQNGARFPGGQGLAPPSSRHKRHRPKRSKHPHYQSKLATHREETDDLGLVVSFHKNKSTIEPTTNNSHLNNDIGSSSSGDTDSMIKPAVIICVDSFDSKPEPGVQTADQVDSSSASSSMTTVDSRTLDKDIQPLVR